MHSLSLNYISKMRLILAKQLLKELINGSLSNTVGDIYPMIYL